ILCAPFLEGLFHSSMMAQPSRKTRPTPKTANHQPWPPAEVLGAPRATAHMAIRADGACVKTMSHSRILCTRGPSRKPGALPPVNLVFISGWTDAS
uniref:Uncharacterized protein n=1 Tax=Neovison vison TaxID=452646 RepID=A0A8C7AM73_NEOVI